MLMNTTRYTKCTVLIVSEYKHLAYQISYYIILCKNYNRVLPLWKNSNEDVLKRAGMKRQLMERIRGRGGGLSFMGLMIGKQELEKLVVYGKNEVNRHRSRLNLCEVSVILRMSVRLRLQQVHGRQKLVENNDRLHRISIDTTHREEDL